MQKVISKLTSDMFDSFVHSCVAVYAPLKYWDLTFINISFSDNNK